MRLLPLLVLSSLLLCAAAQKVPKGKRLIQFSETRKEWLDMSEVDKLTCQQGIHNFMDVTDFDTVGYYQAVGELPIPTEPVQQDYVRELLPLVQADIATATITKLSEFYTRYYRSQTGVDAAHWIRDRLEELAFGRDDVEIANFTHPAFPQPSIIATIPGNGPNYDQYVIIGAHLDSVGSTSTGRSPGADDDASGTATVLEIFRVLVQKGYVPDFTLQFIAYAGEEGGLLGSQGIAADYLKRGVPVHAVLQLDMTGYNTGGKLTTGVVTDYTNAELSQFVRVLVDTYTTLKYGDYRCGYACSDHASWNRTGFRSAFPFESPFGSDPNIHSQYDLIADLDPQQIVQFVNLGIGFAVEVAGVAPQK